MENSRRLFKVYENDVSSNISCFINTAMRKQISWNSLALILNEMASTLDISKQVIKVLLDALQSVTENDVIDKEENAKVNSKEIQKNAVSDEKAFDDLDNSLSEIGVENDEAMENEELQINEPEIIEMEDDDDDIEEMNRVALWN